MEGNEEKKEEIIVRNDHNERVHLITYLEVYKFTLFHSIKLM